MIINFVDLVYMNTGGIVFVYAPWCGHCQKFKPTWDKLKKKFYNKIPFYEINYETNKELAKNLNVNAFPAILFRHNGRQVDYNGNRTLADLENFTKVAIGLRNS